MKKGCIIFLVLAVLAIIFCLYYVLPLYRSAALVAEKKARLNIIAATKSHAEILSKPVIYAGKGAIIPPKRVVKVGPTPLFVDMQDRALVMFQPESVFRIEQAGEARYVIDLSSGGLYFKSSPGKGLYAIKTRTREILLQGTEGMVDEDEIHVLSGSVSIGESVTVGANQMSVGGEVKALPEGLTAELSTVIASLEKSDQKDTYSNLVDYIPRFETALDQNSLSMPIKGLPSGAEPSGTIAPQETQDIAELGKAKEGGGMSTRFIADLLTKKIRVYYDMYILRMSITTDMYFHPELKFPGSIESINDEVASKLTSDPWGNRYLYTVNGPESFNIRSAGPDKAMNTKDDLVLFKSEQTNSIWQL